MTGKLSKHTRIEGDQRTRLAEEMKNHYGQGKSIRQLADDTGRSFGFIHRLLGEAGVELRARGGATRKRIPGL